MKTKKKILLIALLLISFFTLVGCNVTMYTVTFDANGGSAVKSKSTMSYVARPEDPVKDGYEFAGWYTDEALTTPFDFSSKIADNVTLYAKWVLPSEGNPSGSGGDNQGTNSGNNSGNNQGTNSGDNQGNNGGNNQGTNTGDNTPKEYTVKFETNGGNSIADAKTTAKVSKPADPQKENYRFDGWYTDSSFNNVFDFNSTITSDLTLYAKWTLIEQTDYKEGTFNSDQVDPYILAMDFSSHQVSNSQEYAYYLDYAVLNKLASIELTVPNGINLGTFLNEGMNKMQIGMGVNVNVTLLGTNLTTTFIYDERATTSASLTDQYVQVPFLCVSTVTARQENYNGFKINQVTNTYPVTDTDQLCYVLERGYRPTFTSEVCVAKRMYDEACNVLRDICDDSFSDIEKLHAIYDWLIENVTYDEALLNKVITNESDVKKYKGFYLEGVFEDKRAVCDGISKAFMVMARIEGIECVQVSGKSKETNVGHAWNKVRLDGRWYIIDATGGGLIIGGEKEVLSHRLFMCNDEYYNTKYQADNYVNFVADSEYNFYRDLTYTYKGEEHNYYISDVDELADILAYYKSLSNYDKTIDFYYVGENISADIHEALSKAHISGSYSTITNDGAVIFKLAN